MDVEVDVDVDTEEDLDLDMDKALKNRAVDEVVGVSSLLC